MSKQQRKRQARWDYVAEGLLDHPPALWVPGRSGKQTIWPADTQAREAIIVCVRDRLNNFPGAHFEYRYAANELLFLGHDLYGPAGADHTRNFLVTFQRAWAYATRLPMRQEDQSGSEKRRTEQRTYIKRRVSTVFNRAGVPRGLDRDVLDIHDIASYLLLNEQGIAPRAMHGARTPQLPAQHFDERADILADKARISDQRIAWAISEARIYAGGIGEKLVAHLMSLSGIPEAEWMRLSIIGHGYCATRHTFAQAMLPHLAATFALNPDEVTHFVEGNPLALLEQAYKDLGGLIIGYLGP